VLERTYTHSWQHTSTIDEFCFHFSCVLMEQSDFGEFTKREDDPFQSRNVMILHCVTNSLCLDIAHVVAEYAIVAEFSFVSSLPISTTQQRCYSVPFGAARLSTVVQEQMNMGVYEVELPYHPLVLQRLVEYLLLHVEIPSPTTYVTLNRGTLIERGVHIRDLEFLEQLLPEGNEGTKELLFDVVSVAEHLDIQPLFHLLCLKVVTLYKLSSDMF
jgi:hypothetical protein